MVAGVETGEGMRKNQVDMATNVGLLFLSSKRVWQRWYIKFMMYIQKFNYGAYRNLVKCHAIRVGLMLRLLVVLVAYDTVVDLNTLPHSYFYSGSPDLTRHTLRFLT